MNRILSHPILDIAATETTSFTFEGTTVLAQKGFTIAAALHQAGFPVHSHSLRHRERSLECGIGKCGACEMLVDGHIRRICITKADGVQHVREIPHDFAPQWRQPRLDEAIDVYKTTVAIIGAGPAGLACREELRKYGIDNIVIDNNDKIGGQFLMQTHAFFFFEKEKKFGGMRGFDIAHNLAGSDHSGILLNSSVWDLLEGKRIAVKNLVDDKVFYVDADYLVVATGAVPFMPAFENDDLPGVYTAAVVQKMMNNELTLLGRNVLTVGAGNIGYLTSYQLFQAGAKVKAIIEAQSFEGGFPVQANRVRRLGIPILTSHILLKALPNKDHTGISGAVIAQCNDFKAIPGTEKVISGIDVINICTGLVPDDQLIIKGNEVFGRNCYGAGDAIRIGEGTSAVHRGVQVAREILLEMGENVPYGDYLRVSKEYIDSQQHPVQLLQEPFQPDSQRIQGNPFVLIDCLYGFACNPCEFACPHGAITKTSTSAVPVIDYQKCIGCMDCVYQCPGLAIFGYAPKKDWLFLPVEYEVQQNTDVFLVDNQGKIVGNGIVEKVLHKPNKTHVARVKSLDLIGEDLMLARGFIIKSQYDNNLNLVDAPTHTQLPVYVCHCDDVSLDEILHTIGERRFISVDEIKHTTRLGMGACRGKRCIGRLKRVLRAKGISIVGDATPRGPLSNQLALGEMYPRQKRENILIAGADKAVRKLETPALIAGGGIGGSALFRYMAEAGMKPLLINYGRGASWRNIAGGRPAFSLPEMADIARHNLEIFRDLQQKANIDFVQTRYVNFAHDQATWSALDESRKWSDVEVVGPKRFQEAISPAMSPELAKQYLAAFITRDCWQASPGRVVDLIRRIGVQQGGTILEDCKLLDVRKDGDQYIALARDHERKFVEISTPHFVNALGPEAALFARQLGFETGLYPVKHQAFITRRLPNMGIQGRPLDMLIDRRHYKGFTAVYGQQLAETGQIIGCASPMIEPLETDKNLKINSKEFLEIISEVFVSWLPALSSVGFQAVWAGYYVEPRMILDPEKGLFVGMRGQGFMLGMYLAKMYVDSLLGRPVPEYLSRMSLGGDGLLEKAFK